MNSINKNRILFVIQNDFLGGAEQLLKLLATEFASTGHDVTVIIMRAPIENNWDDLSEKLTFHL
jgi:hypothetical protein